MDDVIDQMAQWIQAGRRVALATVVAVERRAPRDAGAAMVVNDQGQVAGSVSGGCVEPALGTLGDGQKREARITVELTRKRVHAARRRRTPGRPDADRGSELARGFDACPRHHAREARAGEPARSFLVRRDDPGMRVRGRGLQR